MFTKLLKKAVPAPLRPPIRRAVTLLFPPLRRRQLNRIWRRRLKRRVHKQLNRRWRKQLNRRWRKQLKPVLKPIWLHARLYIWRMRRRKRSVEVSNQVHLINPLSSLSGGAPLRTVHLFDELKDSCEVFLWTEHKAGSKVVEKYPVKQIVPERFEFPETGTFVFVGTYFSIGPWIRYTDPKRIILIHNIDLTPEEFHQKLRQLSNKGRRKVEVVYASELTKSLVNYPGTVETSIIDINRFAPAADKTSDLDSNGSFTIGRLSRGVPKKHHPDDPALYRALVEHGCRVKIMGATPSMEAEFDDLEEVTMLPARAQEAHLFLQDLDCFFYRTSEKFLEPWGRVVIEAMASRLPVVCHNRGGYIETIDHGRNGFLFDTQEEALEILLRLKDDRALRESVGKAARETVEDMFSVARRAEIVEFYLS